MTTPSPATKRKLLLWLGCSVGLFLVLLVAVGVVLFQMARRQPGDRGATLPANWRGVLRAGAVLPPEAALFAPARTDSGNAAALLLRFREYYGTRATVQRLERGIELSRDDSAALRQAARDTALDALLGAARMMRYSVTPLLLADTTRGGSLFGVRIASLFPHVAAGAKLDALTLRGHSRFGAGQRAAARRDLEAAIGLGLMRYQREPTWGGSRRGLLSVIGAAATLARGLERSDTATAAAARRLAEWARTRYDADVGAWRGLFATPDSGLAALVDTTLPFPVRATALYDGSLYWTVANPWRAFRGPPAAVWRRVHAYADSPDPDLAALAVAADSALTRIGRVGRWQRVRRWYREAR